jgi:hypothetical protein
MDIQFQLIDCMGQGHPYRVSHNTWNHCKTTVKNKWYFKKRLGGKKVKFKENKTENPSSPYPRALY